MRISGARSHHLQTVECNKAAAAPAGGHHPRPRALFTPTTRLWDAGIRVPLAARFLYIQMPTVTGALGASPATHRATSGTSGSRILLGPPLLCRLLWAATWARRSLWPRLAPPKALGVASSLELSSDAEGPEPLLGGWPPDCGSAFPKPPLEAVLVPNVPGPQDNDVKRRHSSAQHPSGTWSPGTVRITPPECRVALVHPGGLHPPSRAQIPVPRRRCCGHSTLARRGKTVWQTTLVWDLWNQVICLQAPDQKRRVSWLCSQARASGQKSPLLELQYQRGGGWPLA